MTQRELYLIANIKQLIRTIETVQPELSDEMGKLIQQSIANSKEVIRIAEGEEQSINDRAGGGVGYHFNP